MLNIGQPQNRISSYEVIGMEYTLTKTIETANAKIRVFSPVLTPEERERRIKAIHKAAAELLKKS